MKTAFFLVALSLFSLSAQAQSWNVDAVHSNVVFAVDHMVVSEVQGTFKIFDGKMNATKPDMTDASIEFNIDVPSISTDNDMRDKHLKSDDFFNAEKFPKIHFKSTKMVKTGDNSYKLTGMLTIRDVAKEVTFDVHYGGEAKNPYGKIIRGFKADLTINRFDYNLQWSKLTELGGAVVGKDVRIHCNLEMVKS